MILHSNIMINISQNINWEYNGCDQSRQGNLYSSPFGTLEQVLQCRILCYNGRMMEWQDDGMPG